MANISKINLNGTTYDIVDSAATLAIQDEVTRATAAESANTTAIATEVAARQSGDTILQNAINGKADAATTYSKTDVDNLLAAAATATTQEISSAVSGKQDTLTAGTGIAISSGNVISCTIDSTLYVVVTTLPAEPASGNENKIHLVPDPSGVTGNEYIEYLWKGDAWEQIGKTQIDTDLSNYYNKSEVDNLLSGKTDQTVFTGYTGSTSNLITSAQTTADNAATAISTHAANTNNPHQVTAAQLGISASYDSSTETLTLNIPAPVSVGE